MNAASSELGSVFTFTGVSGSGKSTLCHKLEDLGKGKFSVSHTTRTPGPMETEGVDYYFVSEDEFNRMLATGQMVEHAVVHGHSYGTSCEMVESIQQSGESLLLEIDVQGVTQVRGRVENLHTIFILPPSFEVLEERLHKRKREGREDIMRRLRHGLNELAHINEFDYLLLNDGFDSVVDDALLIVDTHSRKIESTPELEALLTASQPDTTKKWIDEVESRLKYLHG